MEVLLPLGVKKRGTFIIQKTLVIVGMNCISLKYILFLTMKMNGRHQHSGTDTADRETATDHTT